MKMRIALDVDNVVADYNAGLRVFYNKRYGKEIDFKEPGRPYRYADFLGITSEEETLLLSEYSNSSEFEEIIPIPGSVIGVQTLSKKHDLWCITARLPSVYDRTISFIDKYFGDYIHDVIMTGKSDITTDRVLTKGTVCTQLGIDLLVDDHISNAEEVAACGIPVLLFTTYANMNLYPNPFFNNLIYRVDNWDQITETIEYMDIISKRDVGHGE